jgi:hypothetical protein
VNGFLGRASAVHAEVLGAASAVVGIVAVPPRGTASVEERPAPADSVATRSLRAAVICMLWKMADSLRWGTEASRLLADDLASVLDTLPILSVLRLDRSQDGEAQLLERTEREGFEPSVGGEPYTGLAIRLASVHGVAARRTASENQALFVHGVFPVRPDTWPLAVKLAVRFSVVAGETWNHVPFSISFREDRRRFAKFAPDP